MGKEKALSTEGLELPPGVSGTRRALKAAFPTVGALDTAVDTQGLGLPFLMPLLTYPLIHGDRNPVDLGRGVQIAE